MEGFGVSFLGVRKEGGEAIWESIEYSIYQFTFFVKGTEALLSSSSQHRETS